MQDNDDNPTVVIDFNALKEELKKSEEIASDDELGIEFQVAAEDEIVSEPTDENAINVSKNVYFFDFQSSFFQEQQYCEKHDKFNLVTELKDLNKILQTDPQSIIVFFYNAAPKAVNQLTTQIKSKFTQTKSIIIAKNLSEQKAKAHQATAAGAHGYLTDQSSEAELFDLITTL